MDPDEITRGDSKVWDIPIEDATGVPMPLHDCTVTVTARTAYDAPAMLFQHRITIDAAGDVVPAETASMTLGPGGVTAGLVIERLDPDESVAFAPGDYIYDLEITYPSPVVAGEYDRETKINGAPLVVKPDLTTEATP